MMSIKPIPIQPIKHIIGTGKTDDYELICRVGSGRYGEVFEAFNVTNNRRVAIKVLKPVRPDKVNREINVLKYLSDGPNIISLRDIIINNGIPALVFSFISKDTLKTLGPIFNEHEIHYYMSKLLSAIDYTHSHNIIHRDIKPSNVVIDRSRRLLRLIDWGLADFHTSNKIYSVTVATRHYKSPELLCKNPKYDYSLDMWSFGCIIAGLVFKCEPFFQGLDDFDQLKTICIVLGTKCLNDYLRKYNLSKTSYTSLSDTNVPKTCWKQFITSANQSLANDMAIDLVDKLLVFDHKFRLTSGETLTHPFFTDSYNNNNIKI